MRRINGSFYRGIALTLAYLLVLQGLSASLVLGLMTAAGPDTLSVICTSRGAAALSPAGNGDLPAQPEPSWECATLCQLASAGAALPAQAAALPAQHPQSAALPPPTADHMPQTRAGLIAAARAPPATV